MQWHDESNAYNKSDLMDQSPIDNPPLTASRNFSYPKRTPSLNSSLVHPSSELSTRKASNTSSTTLVPFLGQANFEVASLSPPIFRLPYQLPQRTDSRQAKDDFLCPHCPVKETCCKVHSKTLQDVESTADEPAAQPQIDRVARRKWRLRVLGLAVLNALALSLIITAVYLAATNSDSESHPSFFCGFTNALPKSLISAFFVFIIAVAGLTPRVQRWLKGTWICLLYTALLFQLGTIIGSLNFNLNLKLASCSTG